LESNYGEYKEIWENILLKWGIWGNVKEKKLKIEAYE